MSRTDLSPAMAANIAGKVVSNTAAQIFGRYAIALCRLGIAALIVRTWGKATFGEYSLLFGLLAIGEWILDFGTTEIFVRDICQDRASEARRMALLACGKLIQIPAAAAVVIAIMSALRYPAPLLEAGATGAMSLVFYAGVLIYHTIFKANLTIHREVVAELISVAAMAPLVWFAAGKPGLGLSGLMACHVVSRALFFVLCLAFGRREARFDFAEIRSSDVWGGLRTSSTVGLIGLLVVTYEALDLLALSKLSTATELGYYSAAQRLIWPVVMALASVGTTLYPVAASYWPHDRAGFELASQRALNIVLLLACAAGCTVMAGAAFLLGILGPELKPGAPALRILAVLLVVKAVSATIGPVLYVLHAQTQALRFIAVAVVTKIVLLLIVTPRFGYIGVAWVAVFVEALFSAVPAVTILQRLSGFHLRWSTPVQLAGAGIAAALCGFLLPGGGIWAGVVAALVYLPLAWRTGAVGTADLRFLLRRGAA